MQFIQREQIDAMEQRFRGTFINTIGGFKPVLLVGTANSKGQSNLSIFSSFFHLGANPPLFGLVVRPDVSPRHTLENILETKQLTLNHIHSNMIENAHHTSARYPREISEFDAAQLTPEFIDGFHAPLVKESRLSIGASLVERMDIAHNGTSILVCEINWVRLPDDAIQPDGFVELDKLNSITCAGLDAYYSTNLLKRLPYAKPGTFS